MFIHIKIYSIKFKIRVRDNNEKNLSWEEKDEFNYKMKIESMNQMKRRRKKHFSNRRIGLKKYLEICKLGKFEKCKKNK